MDGHSSTSFDASQGSWLSVALGALTLVLAGVEPPPGGRASTCHRLGRVKVLGVRRPPAAVMRVVVSDRVKQAAGEARELLNDHASRLASLHTLNEAPELAISDLLSTRDVDLFDNLIVELNSLEGGEPPNRLALDVGREEALVASLPSLTLMYRRISLRCLQLPVPSGRREDASKGNRPSFSDAARPPRPSRSTARSARRCASSTCESRQAGSARGWRSSSSTRAPSRSCSTSPRGRTRL